MNVRHTDATLAAMETRDVSKSGFSGELIRVYRKRMQLIRAAADERDFYALRSLHYEKLKGDRKHQRSMRLNAQFRLILQLEEDGGRTVVIVSIEDYH
jgi:proteic killer suppression protein